MTDAIIQAASRYFSANPAEVARCRHGKGKRPLQPTAVTNARELAYMLLRGEGHPFTKIGAMFGVSRWTAASGYARMANKCLTDKRLSAYVDDVRVRLHAEERCATGQNRPLP